MNCLQSALLAWFSTNKRDLPWRRERSPYHTWISEIMLQQTRVDTVIPYFIRWIERFPDIAALAQADTQDLLQTWEGLGYYSRARSLHKAARIVMENYHGELPADIQLLKKLPGIGAYTAGAITSMAFGLPEAALDGNIRRILSRVYDVNEPIKQPQTEKTLWELAEQTLDREHPGDFNEALMDLGSAICLPTNPTCLICPIAEWCKARENGTVAERPVLVQTAPIPHYIVTAAVIGRTEDDKYLLAKRPDKGLLGGMWEYPGGKQEKGESLEECLKREIHEELNVDIEIGEKIGVYKHAYTHFKVTLHAYHCRILLGKPQPLAASELAWTSPDQLADLPMGKIDRMISNDITEKSWKI